MGDLNAKNKAWKNRKNNTAGNIILEFVERNSFTISYPSDPTYCPNSKFKTPAIIDLMLSNNVVNNTRPFVKNIMSSDHVPVFLRIQLTEHRRHSPQQTKPDYSRTNWQQFRTNLNKNINGNLRHILENDNTLLDVDEVDEAIDVLTEATHSALENSTPAVKIGRSGIRISEDIRKTIKTRNYFRRRWQRNRRESDLLKYKEMVKLVNSMITIEKKKKFQKNLEGCKTGDNKLYKAIRNRRREPVPALKDEAHQCRIFQNKDKAELLANHFKAMHVNPLARESLIFTRGVKSVVESEIRKPHDLNDSQLHSSEVVALIRKLKSKKAPGPDNITTLTLKNYSHCAFELLTKILNACLVLAYFPVKWKCAVTIAVPKPGKDPKLVSSYRPIALLCILSKILEKVILKSCNEFIMDNKILPNHQFGFRAKHSTGHAIAYMHNIIKTGLHAHESTGAVAFDIEKAFDRVWHKGLIYKLIRNNFPLALTKIIDSFLSDRSFIVRIGDSLSTRQTFQWGVPQGSVLSPTLYNIFVADIPIPNTPNTKIIQYADDTVLLTTDKLINNIEKGLTTMTNKISKYYKLWKISINTDKTALCLFTKRKTKQLPDETLTLHNKTIKWETSMKYLGVVLDKRLTLSEHVTKACAKTDAAIRLLYPFLCRASPLHEDTKMHIYKAYVLPLLTYAIPLTASMNSTRKKTLDTKQNKCLRMLLNVSWNSYTSTKTLHKRARIAGVSSSVEENFSNFKAKCSNSDNQIIANLF